MDTNRERQINLASKYNFSAMTEGECFMNNRTAHKMGVEVGDIIYNRFDIFQNLQALIKDFNQKEARLRGVAKIRLDVVQEGANNQRVQMPCRVAILGEDMYGKFPR